MSENIIAKTASSTFVRLSTDQAVTRTNPIGRMMKRKRKLPTTATEPKASSNCPHLRRLVACAYDPMATKTPGKMNSRSTRDISQSAANRCPTMIELSQSNLSTNSDRAVATSAVPTPQLSSSFLKSIPRKESVPPTDPSIKAPTTNASFS